MLERTIQLASLRLAQAASVHRRGGSLSVEREWWVRARERCLRSGSAGASPSHQAIRRDGHALQGGLLECFVERGASRVYSRSMWEFVDAVEAPNYVTNLTGRFVLMLLAIT
jgi:hypothetical protein